MQSYRPIVLMEVLLDYTADHHFRLGRQQRAEDLRWALDNTRFLAVTTENNTLDGLQKHSITWNPAGFEYV